jgi:HPt (histidine-containing phosphotransfer) domain-containing protein
MVDLPGTMYMAPARPPRKRSAAAFNATVRNKLLHEGRQLFIDSIRHDLQCIEESRRRHDQAALLMCIHALKGALLILGENAAANDCVAAEEHIQAHGLDESGHFIDRVAQSLHRLLEQYAKA